MLGLMQDHPLLLSRIIGHAASEHGKSEVISYMGAGVVHRTSYRELERRAKRLAQALARLGVGFGDRVGTLAWNDYRHLELYYAVPGCGAVLNPVNVRLSPEDMAYVVNDAGSTVLFIDPSLVPLVEAVAAHGLSSVRHVVVMAGQPVPARLPGGVSVHCYEELLKQCDCTYEWPTFDESTASVLTYTSGTTGRPKGVLYSHRATLLQCYAVNSADVLGLRAVDRVLPCASMFHAMAWTLPYSAPMMGAALILPGRSMDPESLHRMISEERVTNAYGVPTIWLAYLDYLKTNGLDVGTLKRVLSGGSPNPRSLLEDFHSRGVRVDYSWGMTECGPVVAFNSTVPATEHLEGDALFAHLMRQGRPLFGAQIRIVDAQGCELPRDGKSFGKLMTRGPYMTREYYGRGAEGAADADNWFDSGDVATIDENGFLQLVDRTKDVIKSGGEWISSLALEAIACADPTVATAAVIAARHPKWVERPLLVVVSRLGAQVSCEALLASFKGKVPSWWIPDAAIVVGELPYNAVGKVNKLALRKEYEDHYVIAGARTG